MVDQAVNVKLNGKALDDRNLDELDELEDDEDERVLVCQTALNTYFLCHTSVGMATRHASQRNV